MSELYALYEQLEAILKENAITDVVDMLASVVQHDEWADSKYQAFTIDRINKCSQSLKDKDWQMELDGEEATQ